MRFYPFHVGDYLSHTRHLTHLEDLAYRRMLDFYYLHEQVLAGTAADIARAIGMREHETAVAAVLTEFFQHEGPEWRMPRCDAEIQKYREQVAAGRRGATRRWGGSREGNAPPIGEGNATPIPTKNQEPRTKTKNQKKNTEAPEGVDAQLWTDWLAMRKAKRAPVTPTVLRRLAEEGQKAGWSLAKVLAEMVTRNWQGFRADWVGGSRHDFGNTDYGTEQVQDI
jgi:uncharacterized protein YdaU (DUF1376 family)